MPTTHHSTLRLSPEDPALPPPLARFARRLARLEGALRDALGANAPLLASGVPAPVAHRLHLAGGRAPLFALEALGRLERGKGKGAAKADAARAFAEVTVRSKALEDALGGVDFWWAFGERAAAWRAPEAVQRWAGAHHLMACGATDQLLRAEGWLEGDALGPRLGALGDTVLDVSWPGPKRYRKRLSETLEAVLRHTHEASLALDLNEVEAGVHELRRKVRWFSIYAGALDGAVVLDEAASAPEGWDRYLTPAVLSDRFARLPPAAEGLKPITLPAPLFFALSWLISALGELKDRVQWTETMAQGLAETGTPGTPEDWLADQALQREEVTRLTGEIVAQTLVEDRLLLRLADAVAEG